MDALTLAMYMRQLAYPPRIVQDLPAARKLSRQAYFAHALVLLCRDKYGIFFKAQKESGVHA